MLIDEIDAMAQEQKDLREELNELERKYSEAGDEMEVIKIDVATSDTVMMVATTKQSQKTRELLQQHERYQECVRLRREWARDIARTSGEMERVRIMAWGRIARSMEMAVQGDVPIHIHDHPIPESV